MSANLKPNAIRECCALEITAMDANTTTKPKSFQELINCEPLLLIDFSAEWCGPCKMMKPILEQVKSTIGSKAKIIKVDVDRNPQVSMAYQIQGVPTLILFKKGQLVWRQSGVVQPAALQSLIEQHAAH